MLIRSIYIIFFFLTSLTICFAQPARTIDSLTLLNEQIRFAKLANNNSLVLKTYFNNYFSGISVWFTSKEDLDRAAQFIQEGIDFASAIKNYDYIAIGYTQKAAILRKKGDTQRALETALTALKGFEYIGADSVKIIVCIEVGDCYQAKSESVEASKQYNKAFDIAVKSGNHGLESVINFRLAEIYHIQGDSGEAKRQLYKNILLDNSIKNGEGLIKVYTQLAKVTANTLYIDTVFRLADSLHLENKTFDAKMMLLFIYCFGEKSDLKTGLNYLNSQPELKESYMKGGIANYNFFVGQIYFKNNSLDTALNYLKMAESEWQKDSSISKLEPVYRIEAQCYEKMHDTKNAINYYQKALDFAKKLGKIPSIISTSNSLSKLFSLTGDYKKAYEYKLLASNNKDSLGMLAKDKDMVLLDIYRERKKHEEELHQEEERLHKKHNLQYMGITIGICFLFLCFIVLGMFPVSKLVIKIFGFIYFICVFEFIILLIEHSVLHPITHGDPLKLWGLKIILIALLVPVQQFLEHGLIHFLQSRKLHHARTEWMAKKWWKKKKKTPTPPPDTGVETDTGLL